MKENAQRTQCDLTANITSTDCKQMSTAIYDAMIGVQQEQYFGGIKHLQAIDPQGR